MWTTLVGMIERWWRKKPRLDVVRSVVHLRDAIVRCQKQYERHIAEKNIRHPSPNDRRTFDEWLSALSDLTHALEEIDQVLTIFGPQAHEALAHYFALERGRVDDGLEYEERLMPVATELGEPLDIDVRSLIVGQSFARGIEKLDQFIAQNFKPEEIHAVSTSVWR